MHEPTTTVSPVGAGHAPATWEFDVFTADHDDIKGGGYTTLRSRVVISRQEYPSSVTAADLAACLAVAVHGGMPTAVMPRY